MLQEGRSWKGKKVAMLGTTETFGAAPFSDPDWTIINIGPNMAPFQAVAAGLYDGDNRPRFDEHFECHPVAQWPDDRDHEIYREYLKSLGPNVPVWCFQDDIEADLKWRFPWQELIERFGKRNLRNSNCWVAAKACVDGVTDLGVYGIDLESDEERIAESVGLMFFLDVARYMLGINLHGPKGCYLFSQPEVYPFQAFTPQHLHLKKQEKILTARRATFLEALKDERDRHWFFGFLRRHSEKFRATDDEKAVLRREVAAIDGALSQIRMTLRHV